MKILAIRLKNLASIAGPVDIDFTAEPLASAGLFAITGPTGAGKSTLLDALCLALFGSVPRLGAVSREAKVPDGDGDIATWDPRNLLRRGTGSGHAEVDFIGTDGHRYRARWEANRARDKASGKLQHSRQSLYDLDTEQLLSNQSKTEYKQLIEARLGLNFEQFTRAVMLAQSEFSAFLKADDKERSELLEKLTNASIYTRLGQRAFSKAREAGERHAQLEAEAAHVLPLTDDLRQALDQQLDQARQTLQAHQAQQRQLEAQRAWLAEQQRLHDHCTSAAEALREAEQAADALEAQRQDVQWLEHLAPQRHLFQRQQAVQTELASLQAASTAQHQEQEALHARVAQQHETVQAAHLAMQQAQAQVTEAGPALRRAYAAHDHLQRLAQEQARLATVVEQADQAVHQGQQQLDHLQAQQQRSLDQLATIETALARSAELDGLSTAWQAYRAQLQQLLQIDARLAQGRAELPALQRSVEHATQNASAHQQARALLFSEADVEPQALGEQLGLLGPLLQDNRRQLRTVEATARLHARQQELEQDLAALQQRQAEALQTRQRQVTEGLAAKAELDTAEQALTLTRQLLERQRLARTASVEQLRAQLQDDQPCPVCGSAEHPYHRPEALLESLGAHDQAEERQAQDQVDRLKTRLDDLRLSVGVLNGQIKAYQHQQAQLREQLQPLIDQLAADPLWPTLEAQDAPARSAWLALQQRRLEQDIARDEARQAVLHDVQRQAVVLNEQVQAALEARQQAERQLEQQRQALEDDQQRLDQALEAFTPVMPAALLQALKDDAAQAFLTLDQQVGLRVQQQAQYREEQQEQQARQARLDPLRNEQHASQARLREVREQLTALEAQAHQAQAGLTELLGPHASAEQWQTHVEGALEQARLAEAEANQQAQRLREQQVALAGEIKAGGAREAALAEERQALQTQVEHWRAAHPSVGDDQLERLLAVDDAQRDHWRQALLAADTRLNQARILLTEREARVQQHAALSDEAALPADALEQALETLRAQIEQHEQHCAELRARQADDDRRRDAYRALAADIEAAYQQWQRWAGVNALIGSATGDTFRKFAQGYNLDLLLHHANGQLRQLARRYRLKRGGSALGLLVLDTEMGDELRSVHSLSGGETFLVSLALALGLASMASSTLRIESLFIDEGFGSLDPESLQLAMDALDGLQAQGRKVAVISHVQEMHERIPVQIQVQRQGNGLSKVEVVG